jgi:hypothetical protein
MTRLLCLDLHFSGLQQQLVELHRRSAEAEIASAKLLTKCFNLFRQLEAFYRQRMNPTLVSVPSPVFVIGGDKTVCR